MNTCTTSGLFNSFHEVMKLKTLSSAIVYPKCTLATDDDPVTDCGSTGWAFALFIAWNILSMVAINTPTDLHGLSL